MKTYLVGGAVRDKLLGLTPHEHDWVVVGSSVNEMKALGYEQVGKDFPVFLHPHSKEEYALARTERKSGTGYTGFSVNADPSVTLEQDLSRRDLTINAIAETPDGELVDPFAGRADIKNRVLRHVSAAFVEDPLRVLRVARFLARFAPFGFTVAPETLRLLRTMVASGELAQLTPERVWKEWQKSLTTPAPAKFLELLDQLDATEQVFGEPLINTSVCQHLTRVAAVTSAAELRFASLFISQPAEFPLTAFCQRLAIPNRFKSCAELALQQQSLLLGSLPVSASDIFPLLTEIDYWRRPHRLDEWLTLHQALNPNRLDSHNIKQAASRAKAVDAKQLIAAGLTGPAVGEALTEQRRQAFFDALHH